MVTAQGSITTSSTSVLGAFNEVSPADSVGKIGGFRERAISIDRPHFENHDFSIKQGATQPVLEAELVNKDDTEKNLSGATVHLRMRQADASSRQVDSQCTIPDPSSGLVQYRWDSADTDTVGHFNAEFAIDYSGSTGSMFDADEYVPSEDYLTIRVQDTL